MTTIAEGNHTGTITHTVASTRRELQRLARRQRDRADHGQRHGGRADHAIGRLDQRHRRRRDRQLHGRVDLAAHGQCDGHGLARQPGERRQDDAHLHARAIGTWPKRSRSRPWTTRSPKATTPARLRNRYRAPTPTTTALPSPSVTAQITDNDTAGRQLSDTTLADFSAGSPNSGILVTDLSGGRGDTGASGRFRFHRHDACRPVGRARLGSPAARRP